LSELEKKPEEKRPTHSQGGTCFFLLGFFFLFYTLTNAGWYKAGDELFMVQVARQMVAKGQIGFDLKEPPQDPHSEDYIAKGPDGRYYTKWGLGQSLVEAPFIFLHRLTTSIHLPTHIGGGLPGAPYHSEWMFLILCPSLISAIGCALVYCLGRRLGYSERIAMVLSLVYGLCTMVWPYSKSLMSEGTLNAVILGGVYGAVSYSTGNQKGWLTVCGACLGFAAMTKITSLVVVPLVMGYLLASQDFRSTLRNLGLFFLPPLLLGLGVEGWHNAVRYGAIWPSGYDKGWGALGFSTPLYVGLWGLLASPGKSFFLYAPVCLFGLVSARGFFQRNRKEALLFLGIAVAYTLPHALWCLWAGDWAWGPRFILVITPYLILPAGVFFGSWPMKSRVAKWMTVGVLAFSVWVQILGVSVHPFAFIQTRAGVVNKFVDLGPMVFTYAGATCEDTFNQFSPRFSHVVGNWWLLKHMIFTYDLWSDSPWSQLGDFGLDPTIWVIGNRTIPFWWPAALPLIVPSSKAWVYPLVALNLLLLVLSAMKVVSMLKGPRAVADRRPLKERSDG
jgi:hypothetical protein